MRADTRSRVPTALDELSDIDAANVARCAKVLLRHPLLRAGGPDGDLLPLVYRHRVVLQEVFAALLGYRLVVERRFARLHKVGAGDDPSRGEPSLTPRGYAYLCLTMAALTGVGRQVLLSRLVADVRSAASEAGIALVDDLADRRALTAALRHLVGLGVITETDGAIGELEALITIHTDLLGQLLGGEAEQAPSVEVAHVVRRRLVEDPVTLHADLDQEQAEWLRRNQRRESELLERCFGLVTEIRAEGVAVTDPEEYLTDVVFPSTGTVARISLLALPELLAVEHEPRADGRVRIGSADVRATCLRLVADYPAAWSRQATEDVDDLVDAVIRLLTRLALLREDNEGLLLSPAAHRWLPRPDDTPSRPAAPEPDPEPGWSLFDEGGFA